MKKFNSLLKISLIAFLGLMVFSCNPDEVDGPSVSLESGTDLISADANLAANTAFNVSVNGFKGESSLKTLTIQVDGSTIDASKVTGVASGTTLIPAGDQDNFTYAISIVSHDAGTAEYSFILTDEAGESDVTKINITVAGQPLGLEVVRGNAHVSNGATGKIMFGFKATKGANDITSVSVKDAAGNLVAKDLLFWDDSALEFANNPLDITGADAQGFDRNIYINVQNLGLNSYTIEVSDGTETASVAISATIGTVFDTIYTALVVNNADGTKKGSVDLHTGEVVSSSAPSRDLMDGGVDLNLPNATNWKKTFKAVQGATMVELGAVDFDAILSRDQAESMYNAGKPASETAALNIGDILVVRADQDGDNEYDYFVIRIDEVNITAADNDDNFVITVKASLDK